ncbi:unnamed protein product [Toxocara canis]|uniref:Secreted protein n=1 Tax=Toxocara canis TaxID=6265 RepID=A0A183V0U0_TOXCA|nr:unnamed protein product [Toxocara canis]
MNANHFALLLFGLFFEAITAVPSLPSSPSSHSGRLSYYPPAEPNYPPVNPLPASAPLPQSDKAAALLDAFNQRFGSKTDTSKPRITSSWNSASRRSKSAEQESPIVHVPKPKCQLLGCEGPLPNDGSIRFALLHKPSQSCYQTFVELNTCVGEKGYPVGMVCTICCDCTSSFIAEMRNSRGYKIGFNRK